MASEEPAPEDEATPGKRKTGRPKLPAPGEDDTRIRRSRRNPVFGRKVRRLRHDAKMSIADLAKAFKDRGFHEISQSSLGRLERGIQSPMNSEIAAFADFFDVEIDWLVRDERLVSDLSRGYSAAIAAMRRLPPQEALRRLHGLPPARGITPPTSSDPRPTHVVNPEPKGKRRKPKDNDGGSD